MAMVIPYFIASLWTLVFLFVSTILVFQTFFPYKNTSGRQQRVTRALASVASTGAGMYALVLLGS